MGNNMEKEALIKKWLENDLSTEELKAFQQLEEYDSFMKLSENAQFFKAPAYNSSEAYKKLQSIIGHKRKSKTLVQRLKPIAQIAAVFLIGILIYSVFFSNNLTSISSTAGQKLMVELPDASSVQLNSLSQLSYSKKTWKKERMLNLEGEAFFKVAKGSQFDVRTSIGTVSVLGTQFNVKNRPNYFEVSCYEGKVSVSYQTEVIELLAGKTMRIINGVVDNDITELLYPTWIDNFSTFKSIPFKEVISEFERQYNVKISTNIDTNVFFTGTFVHNNINLALQSITLPFNLNYTIDNNLIIIKKVE